MTSTKSPLQTLFTAIAESAKTIDFNGPVGDTPHTLILIPKGAAPHVIAANTRFLMTNMQDIVTYKGVTYRFDRAASSVIGKGASVFHEAIVCDLDGRDLLPASIAQVDTGEAEGDAADA